MKYIRLFITLFLLSAGFVGSLRVFAQPTILPAKSQDKTIAIRNAVIHVGNGQVIEKGTLIFSKGKIDYVGAASAANGSVDETIDAQGKHVYPGFIAPNTTLGLVEIKSVRATADYAEVGDNNAHVRALIAYNTDSKVINTLRSNGILLAQITPQQGFISGQSSIVQLDAWNWEDAAYQADDGLHIHWPELRYTASSTPATRKKQQTEIAERIAAFQDYLVAAQAYFDVKDEKVTNARFDAFEGVFSGKKRVFVHVDQAEGIVSAVRTLKALDISPVLVGGREAHQVLPLLKENNIAVILGSPHSLPSQVDEGVNMPYKQAKILQDAGILAAYAIDGFWEQRNLPFIAGTAAAFGLDKEEALQFITLNTAKILGIADRTGSLEVGKDANFFISAGDALDMRGNDVVRAFIQGRDIDLNNLHKQLFERYKSRYGMADGARP